MAIYRLLNQQGYSPSHWKIGNKYASEYEWNGVYTYQLVKSFPADWELIKENTMSTEKHITLTLDKAKSMYGKNPEMDELLLANFTKEELTKKNLLKRWEDLNRLEGFFIGTMSETKILGSSMNNGPSVSNQNVFATKKQAESSLAMAQLSQLMAVYNDGWVPDWNDLDYKWVIYRLRDSIKTGMHCNDYKFLVFKSAEIRDEFLANFEPLIKQYFMID